MSDGLQGPAAMRPVRLNRDLLTNISGTKAGPQVDPAFKQITEGLQARIQEVLQDPTRRLSCCIEGCCVSWCCIQLD